MATLLITNLKCEKKQDTVGDDDVVIRKQHVNDTGSDRISGPHKLSKGQDVDLNEQVPFDGRSEIRIVLVEEDKGSDDLLGIRTIKAEEAGNDTAVEVFDLLGGAEYELRYRVLDD